MNKAYQRIEWENYPSGATPLNENNLNKMDAAVDLIDDRVVMHDTTKLETSVGNTLVQSVEFDENTGIFTITKLNGSKATINTSLEKIATNFRYDYEMQKLILTLIDGTTQEIDLSALLTQYEFVDGDIIMFSIEENGKVSASIKNGSITAEKLQPNFLADVTSQANQSRENATKAQSYAVGGTGLRENEDEDNAKYFYNRVKGFATGDTADSTVTFTNGDELVPNNYKDLPMMNSGEKHDTLFEKISNLFQNVRFAKKKIFSLETTVGATTTNEIEYSYPQDGLIGTRVGTNIRDAIKTATSKISEYILDVEEAKANKEELTSISGVVNEQANTSEYIKYIMNQANKMWVMPSSYNIELFDIGRPDESKYPPISYVHQDMYYLDVETGEVYEPVESGTGHVWVLYENLKSISDSVLSTVADCTASTNNNDIAGASALAELDETLNICIKSSNASDNKVSMIYWDKNYGLVFVTPDKTVRYISKENIIQR